MPKPDTPQFWKVSPDSILRADNYERDTDIRHAKTSHFLCNSDTQVWYWLHKNYQWLRQQLSSTMINYVLSMKGRNLFENFFRIL